MIEKPIELRENGKRYYVGSVRFENRMSEREKIESSVQAIDRCVFLARKILKDDSENNVILKLTRLVCGIIGVKSEHEGIVFNEFLKKRASRL